MSSFQNHIYCNCRMTREILDNNLSTDSTEQQLSSTPQQISSGSEKLGITTIAESSNNYIKSISWGGTKWDWSQSSPSNYKLTYYQWN